MNTAILSNLEYQEQIKPEIETNFSLNSGLVSNDAVLWNVHKAYVRGLFIKLSAQEKRRRSEHINFFSEKISQLEQSNKQNPNDTYMASLHALREELRSYLYSVFDHHVKRLWLTWYMQGNRPGARLD